MKLAVILTACSVIFIVVMALTNFQGKGKVVNDNGYVEINLGEFGRTKILDGHFIKEFNKILERSELAYSGFRPRPRSKNVGFLHFRKQPTKVEFYNVHIGVDGTVFISVPNGNWVRIADEIDKEYMIKVIDYKVGG